MSENFSFQQHIYQAFETLIAGEDAAIDLARAALLIAGVEYPDLDAAHYLAQLDALAERVRALLGLPGQHTSSSALPGEPLAAIEAMNQVLIEQEGFHGNQDDYYNPNNSFLNKVLESHTGIPITLSLLYIEVGRRVGLQIDGIGLPFHFVTGCSLPNRVIYIDPYEGGELLSEQDCWMKIRRIAGGKVRFHAHWFEPVSRRHLLVRMLHNLKHIYIDKERYEQALFVCELLVMLQPSAVLERRDRGIVHLQLKHYVRALRDLVAYTQQTPQAEDHAEIQGYINTLRRTIAMMN